MKDMNEHTIAGVKFTAAPVPHGWHAKVDATGFILPQGYTTRPAMWRALDDTARRIGAERFARECLAANR